LRFAEPVNLRICFEMRKPLWELSGSRDAKTNLAVYDNPSSFLFFQQTF